MLFTIFFEKYLALSPDKQHILNPIMEIARANKGDVLIAFNQYENLLLTKLKNIDIPEDETLLKKELQWIRNYFKYHLAKYV